MKKVIYTDQAPNPIGPYSQAMLVNNTLYTSGQIALHPKTNELVLDNIEVEAKQVLDNLKAVLLAADMQFEDIINTTIYLTDMADFTKVNTIYESYFNGTTYPARTTIAVSGLPKGVHVEISAIACV